ncbi:hypothetical protein [Streptomyces roseifaciens]|uniref:hypothetical protein n=1 Tax=Streptomyces roseifaciens TaxID=1488406 RepID=UPI00071800DD|nr:hypothetical protein [Streptomyces roseifaciens]
MALLDMMAEVGTTGGIGVLRCGAPLADIAAVLGPAEDLGRIDEPHLGSHRFFYGDVEFIVCRCRVVSAIHISTWYDRPLKLPVPGANTVVSFPPRMTYRQVTSALDAIGCPWRLDTRVPDTQVTVLTEPAADSWASFTFASIETSDDPALDEPRLYSVGAWTVLHECPPISVDPPDHNSGLY